MDAWALRWHDPVDYDAAVRFMEAVHAARVRDEIPNTLLLLQHEPVVTLGRRRRSQHLLLTPAELAARGIELRVAGRGGDVTFHGPGQWVLYPIIRLGQRSRQAHGYLTQLEEIAIRTAERFGVVAFRRPGMAGAWTNEGKIAAIGFYIRRWVTLHGMSFNVMSTALVGFGYIVPCGLVGERVSCLSEGMGAAVPTMEEVGDTLLELAMSVLGCRGPVFRMPHEAPEWVRQTWRASLQAAESGSECGAAITPQTRTKGGGLMVAGNI